MRARVLGRRDPPSGFDSPSSLKDTVGAVSDLFALPWDAASAQRANRGICLGHGVATLWTADRDFSYFPQLKTHKPLLDLRR